MTHHNNEFHRHWNTGKWWEVGVMAGAWAHRYTVASYYCKTTFPASFMSYIKLYWCCSSSVTCRCVPCYICMGPKGIYTQHMSLGDQHYYKMSYGLRRLWEKLPSPVKEKFGKQVRWLSMWTPGSNGLGSDSSFPTYCVGDLGKIPFYVSFSDEDTAGTQFMWFL